MLCYRIVRPARVATALSGEGARLYGGRWNPPGMRCVYAAESRALGILEMLVHLTGRTRALPYRVLTLEVDERLVAPDRGAPVGWDAHPAGPVSQGHGGVWLEAARFAALRVPSVVVPEESNLLLNPQGPGFASIRIVEEAVFRLDRRLG